MAVRDPLTITAARLEFGWLRFGEEPSTEPTGTQRDVVLFALGLKCAGD
jgi:hypothetical protein